MSFWTVLTWMVFAALLLALLFALLRKAPAAAAPAASGMQALTPAMAALMPPRELARRWADFLPLFGSEKRPVFLALGGGDDARKRLWLSTPECKYLRDEPSGLAFAVYADSLWVDVPASFVSPPAAEEGLPAAAAGAPGLWEELVRFLPELPGGAGRVRGAAVFIDAARDSESAARDALWIAGKLDRLYTENRNAGRGKSAPALWIVSTGLEKFPGGARLLEKTGILSEPFGALSRTRRDRVCRGAFDVCLAALESGLDDFLRSCDATGQGGGNGGYGGQASGRNETLSPEIHLLRHFLADMTRNAGIFCDAVAHAGKAKAALLGGIFLCGEAPRGLAFGAGIPRNIAPGHARRSAREKPHTALYAATALFLLAGLAGAGVTYSRARTFIDAVPFRLLDASPTQETSGGAPPVARYARAHAALERLEHSHPLTRRVYAAPDRALDAAAELFAPNLSEWLPAPDAPALTDAWIDGLSAWAEGRKNVAPLAFATLSGKRVARVRGAHSGAGRKETAELLSAFRRRLDKTAQGKIDFLQNEYDKRLRADWRRNGEALLAATLEAAEQDDFANTKDFLASDAATAFVRKAGAELDFPGADAAPVSEWARSAIAAAGIMKNASQDSDDGSDDAGGNGAAAEQRFRAYRETLAALHPRSLDETAISDLAADTYSPPGGNPPPPSLADAGIAWNALESALRTREPLFASTEGKEVSALLQSRQTLLRRAALKHAAARVQAEWDELLRMPLENLTPDDALLLMLDEKPHRAFAKGFAHCFLVPGNQGLRPAHAPGEDFPFTEEAVAWLNRAEEITAALDAEYPVRIALLPVTVDRDARIFPRGIRFTQSAKDGSVTATGYNNTVETAFVWSPRTCSDVEIAIYFDAFTLRKIYPGRLGFLHFLQSLKNNTLVLPADSFPEARRVLERGAVRSLRVHFELPAALRSLSRLPAGLPPPPAAATRIRQPHSAPAAPSR